MQRRGASAQAACVGHLISYLAGEVIPFSLPLSLTHTHTHTRLPCRPHPPPRRMLLAKATGGLLPPPLPLTVWCKQPALKSPETAARFLSFSSPGSKTSASLFCGAMRCRPRTWIKKTWIVFQRHLGTTQLSCWIHYSKLLHEAQLRS